jgi:hypothetical protein
MVFSILSIVPAYAVQVGSINQFNINGASSDKNLGNNNTTDNSTTNQTANTETKNNEPIDDLNIELDGIKGNNTRKTKNKFLTS